MSHHKVITTITKIAAGDRTTRNLGDSAYVQSIVPQDGFAIKTESGGVSHICFVTVEDFEAAKKLEPGKNIVASGWNAEPTKEALEAAKPPPIPKK